MKSKRISISAICLSLVTVLILVLTGCNPYKNTGVTKTGFYLDTVISVTLYEKDSESLLEGCMELTKHYEDLLSDTIETSDISRINAFPEESVVVDPDTAELLKIANEYKEKTDGAFDPCIGGLTKLWDFHEDSDKTIPDENKISSALSDMKDTYYEVYEENGEYHVTLHGNGKIDLGGIAKGYIADKIREYLNDNFVTEGVINLGGNVLTVGPKDGNKGKYKIGLQKPFTETGETIGYVSVNDSSVVTSGIYQRYFEKEGKLYHHILNTETGYPVENDLNSVTIISEDSTEGDALSTYVFTLGLDEGLSFVEDMPYTEAIFIDKDDNIYFTSGADDLFTKEN